MGLPASLWNEVSFASKGVIACRTIACMYWLPSILHQIGSTVYVPTYLSIDTALAADLSANILGPVTSTDADK